MAGSVEYAEETLGIHKVWEEAQLVLDEIELLNASLVSSSTRRRMIQDMMADREMTLVTQIKMDYPDWSGAATERQLKEDVRKDDTLRSLRQELADAQTTHETASSNLELAKAKERVLTSRMIQLGGYLNYLAASKQDQTLSRLSR